MHGGIMTGASADDARERLAAWSSQYTAIRGAPPGPPMKVPHYIGHVPRPALRSVLLSAREGLTRPGEASDLAAGEADEDRGAIGAAGAAASARSGSLVQGRPVAEVPGPNVIGATGGSGTRVVARIVRRGGMFIGASLNASEDALEFGDYADRWVNRLRTAPSSPLPPTIRAAMIDDLHATVDRHLAQLDADAGAWGWKEPRSIILLPFLAPQLAGLKFLHLIRDGRDMAYSSNQNQLSRHGPVLLGDRYAGASPPVRSIALWSDLNLSTAEYGETVLRERYLRIRFEDLCRTPAATIRRIFEFFGLVGDPDAIAALEVRPPPASGHWRAQPADIREELLRVAGAALERFGYDPTDR
jgi:hypothetical protein